MVHYETFTDVAANAQLAKKKHSNFGGHSGCLRCQNEDHTRLLPTACMTTSERAQLCEQDSTTCRKIASNKIVFLFIASLGRTAQTPTHTGDQSKVFCDEQEHQVSSIPSETCRGCTCEGIITDFVRREGVVTTTILARIPATIHVARSRTMLGKIGAIRSTPASTYGLLHSVEW